MYCVTAHLRSFLDNMTGLTIRFLRIGEFATVERFLKEVPRTTPKGKRETR
jgi:hypothetical protein